MKTAIQLLADAVTEMSYGRTFNVRCLLDKALAAEKRENEARGTMVATVIEDEAYARGFRDAKAKLLFILNDRRNAYKTNGGQTKEHMAVDYAYQECEQVQPTPKEEIDY